MNDAVIEIRDVAKVYQMGDVKVHALRGVSLEIGKVNWWRSWGHQAPANRR